MIPPPVLPPPMTQFENPSILKFVFFMLGVRNLVAHPIIVLKLLKFPDTYGSSSAASSFVAIMFSVPVCFATYRLLYMQGSFDNIGTRMSAFSDEWNELTSTTLVYTCAYMIQDTLMMIRDEIRYESDDPYLHSYLLHHAGCLIYLSMVHYYSAGAYGVMVLIFMGEVTNPVQNLINICHQGIKGGKSWPRAVLRVVNPIFGLFFAVVRLVIAPLYAGVFTHELIVKKYRGEGASDVPIWVGMLWCTLIWLTIRGSLPFAIEKLRDGGFFFWEKGEKKVEKSS
jgi:hypothetical protein